MADSSVVPAALIPLFVLLGFPLLWFLVTHLLMRLAGLSRGVNPSSLGSLVESYGSGSARINGINFSGCMIVERYQRGYLLRLWWIFGGGMRVVPSVDIESISQERYFFRDSVVIKLRKGSQIRLYGQFVKKFS